MVNVLFKNSFFRYLSFICFVLFASMSVYSASTGVTIDGLNYTLKDDETATVTGASSGVTKIVIPEKVEHEGTVYSVTAIQRLAFNKLTSLTSLSIPGSVVTVGDNILKDNTNLTELIFEPSSQKLELNTNFFDKPSSNLSSTSFAELRVYIHRPLTGSAGALLENASSAVYCEISGVEELNSVYIAQCQTLTTLVLHEDLRTIISNSFANCNCLTVLIIPEGVIEIKNAAFDYLKNLERIYLPSTLKSISPVYDSPVLKDVYCYGTEPPVLLNNKIFWGSAEGLVHVYPDCVELYRKAFENDPHATIIGDLTVQGEPTRKVKLNVEGEGCLEIISVNDEELAEPYTVSSGELTVNLKEDTISLTITTFPLTTEYELENLIITDTTGEKLPANIRVESNAVQVQIACVNEVSVHAVYRASTASTLHIVMPQNVGNMFSLNIPHNSNYIFDYSPTPGYTLKQVLLDDEDILTNSEKTIKKQRVKLILNELLYLHLPARRP